MNIWGRRRNFIPQEGNQNWFLTRGIKDERSLYSSRRNKNEDT